MVVEANPVRVQRHTVSHFKRLEKTVEANPIGVQIRTVSHFKGLE